MSAIARISLAAGLAAVCCAHTADAARLPAISPCLRGVDVPITIYNRSHMTASGLDAVVETASRLWRPYRVTLAAGRKDGVAVIVSDGSSEPEASRQAGKILGTTMFSDGHAMPYIHLWVGAAEAVLESSGSSGVWSTPTNARDSRLQPMLGVALAHEIGHFLLDTSDHARVGILRRAIPVPDLQHPTPDRLGLSGEQQLALCASKENQTPGLSQ